MECILNPKVSIAYTSILTPHYAFAEPPFWTDKHSISSGDPWSLWHAEQGYPELCIGLLCPPKHAHLLAVRCCRSSYAEDCGASGRQPSSTHRCIACCVPIYDGLCLPQAVLEVHLVEARDLMDTDLTSQSDPYAVITGNCTLLFALPAVCCSYILHTHYSRQDQVLQWSGEKQQWPGLERPDILCE